MENQIREEGKDNKTRGGERDGMEKQSERKRKEGNREQLGKKEEKIWKKGGGMERMREGK